MVRVSNGAKKLSRQYRIITARLPYCNINTASRMKWYILMNMAMWDANKRVKSFCARLKQQVNPVSAVELGTATKIYQTYFVTMRISTWHIKNMIN